jgi:hypothetical protein
MDFRNIFSIAKSLSNLAISELGPTFTRNAVKELVSKDHFGQLLISKAPTISDKLKIILTSWFIVNKPKMSADDIYRIINNLYVVTVEIYDETDYIKEECHDCYGDGYLECGDCEGSGKEDCRYCDGEGDVDCDECSGSGREECRYCDGRGTETDTEEDDEGDEVEVDVDCVHCDGSGEESCRDCGGGGNFECSQCEGTGNEECNRCEGNGSEYCNECGGSGEVDSGEVYYNVDVYEYLVVGNYLDKIDMVITKEQFDEIEETSTTYQYYMTLNYSTRTSDDNADDTRDKYGMEDSFVVIEDVTKLEEDNYIKVKGLS